MDFNKRPSEKVISQVNQIIEMLPKSCKEQIPEDFREFFEKNDTKKEEYKLKSGSDIKKELEEETLMYVASFIKDIELPLKSDIEYISLDTSWKGLEKQGKIKEAIEQLDLELATNFYNVNNILADRELADIKFVYNIRYYGKTTNPRVAQKLEPFVNLCNVFCILHKKFVDTQDLTLIETYKYVEKELRELLY